MKTITIITIVVVALLTAIIFTLTWLAYNSCLRAYKVEIDAGKHDEDILEQSHKRKKGIWELIGLILFYIVLTALAVLFVTGIIYKISGNNIIINHQTILVIKTESMSNFYNDKRAEEYNNDTSLQFDIGDICFFNTDFELIEGEVYGYKYRDIIITHRLINYNKETGLCEFRGDYNNSSDSVIYGLIPVENIIYHYTGNKIKSLGVFILYAQSYFGIWSLLGIVGITISSEIVYYKIDKINKERFNIINIKSSEENIDEE